MAPQTNTDPRLSILEKMYGERTTALRFRSDFQLLVATILSAQSTDDQVNKITAPLFADYPDAAALAALSVEELEEKIKRVGLFRNKARNISAAARMVLEEFGGKVPRNREELMKLPGVGRKTANVVMSVAFGIPAIAVDTHVFRVANRLGLAQARNERETEEQLMSRIPQEKWSQAHHWLIWHGRQLCRAQSPRCTECPLSGHCAFFQAESARKAE